MRLPVSRLLLLGALGGTLIVPPAPAQPAPPMPPGTTASHYLLGTADADDPVPTVVFNRFQWWDKEAPPRGAITEPFENEFCPPLARVVGDPTGAPAGFTVNSWVGPPTPHHFANSAELATRNDWPRSVPTFVVVPGVRGLPATTVLVNNYQDPAPLVVTDNFRPSLFFDFERGQRAVGLEFGFVPLPGEERGSTSGESVHFLAYNREGQLVVDTFGSTHVNSGDFTNRIGVRSRRGDIFSVELRFERGTGANLRDQQAVLRIWHEPLPPAAVKQGAVTVGGFNPANARGPVSLGSITETLPFNCDRAIVQVRGFWLKFHDNQPHHVGEIAVGFGPRRIVRTTTPGGSVTWTPTATMQQRQGQSGTTTDALVYYSILAWDSQQTELLTGEMGIDGDSPQGRVLQLNLQAPDPLGDETNWGTSTDEATWRTQTEAERGHLYAALDRFHFGATEDHGDVTDLQLQVGSYQPLNVRQLFWNPPIGGGSNTNRNIRWPSFGAISGDGSDAFDLDLHATLLAGRSLRSAADRSVGAVYQNVWYGVGDFRAIQSRVPARPLFVNRATEPYWNDGWRAKRARGHSFPLQGDIALVGIWDFEFLPDGPIREIEVEVKGANYDGQVVDWQEGRGMITDDTGLQRVLVLPNFASVRSNAGFARAALRLPQTAITAATFGKPWSSGESTVTRTGIIRNIGTADVLIRDFLPATNRPQDHRFHPAGVIWRGQSLSLIDFLARRPLQLRPNEDLQILVAYIADPSLARDHKPIAETGLMTVVTNNTHVGMTLPMLANVRPDDARATLVAQTSRGTSPSYDFGRVKDSLGAPPLSVFLADVGGVPIKISRFGLRKVPTGFVVRKVGTMKPPRNNPNGPLQQEFQVTYPRGQGLLGVHEDTLTVETNGGTYTLPLRIEVTPGRH